MRKEYNDYQIMSPSTMEEIAKAYNKQLNSVEKNTNLINNDKSIYEKSFTDIIKNVEPNDNNIIEENDTFYNIILLLFLVNEEMSFLKQYCSKRFYHHKEVEINSIITELSELITYLKERGICMPKENQYSSTNKNYCSIITDCIQKLAKLLHLSFDAFITTNKKTAMQKVHNSCLTIISKISNLFTPCKYRSF